MTGKIRIRRGFENDGNSWWSPMDERHRAEAAVLMGVSYTRSNRFAATTAGYGVKCWNGTSCFSRVESRMETQNVAGRGARIMAKDRRSFGLWLIFSSLLCLALFFCANLLNLRTRSVWVSLCCLAGITLIGRGVIPLIDFLKKREGDAIRGAEAEEAVGAILDGLPDNHMVLHDVPGPCGNIDHVVLRKDGAVFVIETKSMSGRVSVRNGRLLVNGWALKKDSVGQTLCNAFHVREILAAELGVEPWVHSAIIFTKGCVSVCEIKRVRVMNVCALKQWMARTPGQREIGRRAAMKWEKIREALRMEKLSGWKARIA